MGYALPVTVQMTDMTCSCGIVYAVPEHWRAEKQRSGEGWHCPNGCRRIYKETDTQRLQRELDAERARKQAALERANTAEAAEQKLSKEVRKLKKRVANGVCPCCTRSFVNLQRHMTTKHPDYTK